LAVIAYSYLFGQLLHKQINLERIFTTKLPYAELARWVENGLCNRLFEDLPKLAVPPGRTRAPVKSTIVELELRHQVHI
jgi:hypothetical protein